MIQQMIDYLLLDRGGRRRIKDRRVRVAARHVSEQRTSLRRRSGWDRRVHQVKGLKSINRRMEINLDFG